jgi:hypothetical protein
MDEEQELQPKRKGTFLNTWKDVVVLLRNTLLLALVVFLVVLLLVFPATFNRLLLDAGIKEVNIGGVTWSRQLAESDHVLQSAQSNITDLTKQNDELSKELVATQKKNADPAKKRLLANLMEKNNKIKQTSAEIKADVKKITDASTDLLDKVPASTVEKAQTATETSGQWGVVYGGNADLTAAKSEADEAANKYGIKKASIFLRKGSYRGVATESEFFDAIKLLVKAKKHRSDASIVDMSKWCPRTQQKAGYAECISP